ncbi:Crp/Fnr family transcriptional regulator [Labrenzia sp. CE80]|uniref:Crp/Fnr family transcriptional regulator n=1 Tax=Labrenzia sp. CE80 TaxID=1788986 RepID=UPI00129AF496|nr:Crp/Fnr family transcriptional regulator [Labrenzia sp. CE80]
MTGSLDHGSLKFMDLLSPEVQSEIEAVERRRTYQDGQMIHSSGDDGDRLIIVRSGVIRVGRIEPNGKEAMLAVLGTGHVIGIIGVLTGRRRSQNAVASGVTTIGLVNKADFLKVMERRPEIAGAILPMALDRLNLAFDIVDDIRLLNLTAFTASLLLKNLPEVSEFSGVLHWKQSELAAAVGVSRVSVGKALKKLEQERLIALKYGAIEVPDAKALADWIDAARTQNTP